MTTTSALSMFSIIDSITSNPKQLKKGELSYTYLMLVIFTK